MNNAYFFFNFAEELNRAGVDVPELSPIPGSFQFHLCSLAHAARKNLYSKKETSTLNYVKSDWVEKVRIKIRRNGGYEEIITSAVGCSVNGIEGGEFDFYVRSDAEDASIVFVVDQEGPSKNSLIVTERVYNVPLQNEETIDGVIGHRL